MNQFRTINTFLLLLAFPLLPLGIISAQAETCLVGKLTRAGKIRLRTVEQAAGCKRSQVALPAGPVGADGEEGADGQLRIYGDGSAGAKTVTGNETFSDTNPQYTDLTINSGATLTVPSGTVIRCSGTFINSGTIDVESSRAFPSSTGGDSSSTRFAMRPANPGIAISAAGDAEYGNTSALREGGRGAVGLTETVARQIRYPGAVACPAGGRGSPEVSAGGELSGGSLVVLSAGQLTNNGLIDADGNSALNEGGGGGAGGIIILASKTGVTNSASAVVTAAGKSGGASFASSAPGGGGSGGIVHFLAPVVDNSGTVAVTQGAQGTLGAAGSIVAAYRSGGGGGGACGGNGGDGGSVQTNNDPTGAQAGAAGLALTSVLDPTALF